MVSDLAPGFLVASPTLADPNFAQSVVLLIEHCAEGSLGFVVNRPASISFRGVVDELGLQTPGRFPPNLPVLSGGPVSPHTGWIVFDPGWGPGPSDQSIEVTSKLRVSASRDFLELLAGAENACRHTLVLGYAGWGQGQLDKELRQGAWIPADINESVIFDTPYPNRWQRALAVLGIEPWRIVPRVTLA